MPVDKKYMITDNHYTNLDLNLSSKFKLVILGGGTAGWFSAAWFGKLMPMMDVTLIESPSISKMGVGESTTPQVRVFLDTLGIDEKDFMKSTWSTHKLGTKFTNWKNGTGEEEFNSFSYPVDLKLLSSNVPTPTSWDHWGYRDIDVSSSDAYIKLLTNGKFDKFDKNFHDQYNYMVNNTAPFDDNGQSLLNPLCSSTYHINSESTADYIRDTVGIPNGVHHIKSNVKEIITEEEIIKKVILDNGAEIEGDFFIDASGFHKVLVKSWPVKEYKNHVVDAAWVCQLDYQNQETEMANYTFNTAQDYGWLFKIGLYHRIGSGYCFNSSMLSEDRARFDYMSLTKNHRFEPALIKWTPHRLEYFAKGNVAAIGLSSGFVEPMEGTALFNVVNSIFKLTKVFSDYFTTGEYNFKSFNETLVHSVDDTADFILIHYTLSSRNNSEMWRSLRDLGTKENHVDLAYEKFKGSKNTFASAIDGYTTFPNYVWAHWAYHAGVDISKWVNKSIDPSDLELARLYFDREEKKHKILSQTRTNNYKWHRDNIFKHE